MEVQPSHPTSTVHSITDVGTSECPDAIILGNNDTSQRVHEISINYIESGESYDRKSTIVDIYFAEAIIESSRMIQILRPWQSAKSAWTGINGKMQFKQNCPHSPKERYSLMQYLHLVESSLWDSNGFSSKNEMRTTRL